MAFKRRKKFKRKTKEELLHPQYDFLTLKIMVEDHDGTLTEQAKLANNLYNAAMYQARQSLFKHHGVLSYIELNKMFRQKNAAKENILYSSFAYVDIARRILQEVEARFTGYFNAVQSYKINPGLFTGKPKLPGYLDKGSRHAFSLNSMNLKQKDDWLIIKPRNKRLNLKVKLPAGLGKINSLIVKPVSGNKFQLCLQYKTANPVQYKPDNGKYVGIDPGVDNAFALVSSGNEKPLLINGRVLKSVNQYYNKVRSRLKSQQSKQHQNGKWITTKKGDQLFVCFETKQEKKVTAWRNAKIMEFAHKASKRIIDYALSCEANTIIIGKNTFWKQKSGMLKKNNQNFIGIPHALMIEIIKYKANLAGITVITHSESYTSQTSFLDGEKPVWRNGNKHRKALGKSPINRRVHRGLFKSNKGILINADVNGALQIIKKAFPDAKFAEGIVGSVLEPVKWSPLI